MNMACIRINDILVSDMDKTGTFIDIPADSGTSPAFILEGKLKAYSTETLHYHSCHQILRISSGVTLLVEDTKKQPLFSNMTAFIPAGLPHRSVVMGDTVHYKSVYLDASMFRTNPDDIVVFDLSELGTALFDRIDGRTLTPEDSDGLDFQCLNLLLRLMEAEIHNRSHSARIPVASDPDNRKITDYIEANFDRKIALSDFTSIVFYSERHISRKFKEDLKLSIFEYLKLYRIFQATLLLCNEAEEPKTITEIAYSCGYESLSSFYKDFKAIFGITPKSFIEGNSGLTGRQT